MLDWLSLSQERFWGKSTVFLFVNAMNIYYKQARENSANYLYHQMRFGYLE